ncbi:hypothetical protein DFH08DRAFT_1080469 [Mycena albidolilacea]|uniref:Glycan binding protein Y3-like domain-containing protein n=1 Tax=Mycena albidolilacea TaxID=1033008 RepID=A0AAD7A1E0_9AGAR|nr:hypothetical protein DFH08DRAFT_1080469 [Mycena albidolilacea]
MFYNLKALTVAAVAVMITPALGLTCYEPADGTKGDCTNFITKFCTSIAGALIAPGDSAAQCFPGPATNLNCDFTAINMGTVANNIDIDTCEDLLRTANAQCGPIGGFGQPAGQGFQYSIDPNSDSDGCAPVDCGPGEHDHF